MNVVAYNIIRPLHATTLFQPNYPTKTILIDLCAFDMDLVDTYIRHWGPRRILSHGRQWRRKHRLHARAFPP
jgi:hypothetical protein